MQEGARARVASNLRLLDMSKHVHLTQTLGTKGAQASLHKSALCVPLLASTMQVGARTG